MSDLPKRALRAWFPLFSFAFLISVIIDVTADEVARRTTLRLADLFRIVALQPGVFSRRARPEPVFPID